MKTKNRNDLFKKLTPAQLIVGFYGIAIIISFILLNLPFVYQEGISITFIDKLFTAVSAVSVTGLSVIEISDTFTTFGIVILMMIFQFGGIGVMTLGTFFWLLLGKKIGLKNRQLIMVDHNQMNLSGVVHLIIDILKIIFLIECIGSIILTLHFMTYFRDWQEAILQGVFLAVSATTNAGFALHSESLAMFREDFFIQTMVIFLLILGAIGFPVLIEVKEYLFSRTERKPFRFSLFAKITSLTYFLLLLIGALFILVIEWRNAFLGESFSKALYFSLFQSTASRSGGLSTIDIQLFSPATLLIMSFLMFIGASPSSVGGGIRTTTFALNILFLYHFSKGHKYIKIFGRELHEDDIKKSMAVTLIAFFLCGTSLILLSVTEDQSLLAILFEICSAFGTTGYSLGITPELSTFGKIVIMLLMFIGRVGLLSFLFMIGGKEKEENYHYPKERIIIG